MSKNRSAGGIGFGLGKTANGARWHQRDSFSMYYGNAKVVDASDPQGIYDVNQALVYHFNEGETLPHDATAYGLNASAIKSNS